MVHISCEDSEEVGATLEGRTDHDSFIRFITTLRLTEYRSKRRMTHLLKFCQ